jgi:hypothetical protein
MKRIIYRAIVIYAALTAVRIIATAPSGSMWMPFFAIGSAFVIALLLEMTDAKK